ncbi:flagellar filament capping protein FliD [Kineosporia babensis]|uniref:Flagellar hook-associated protein 2 n=1 Tax=Kineosporia babensis TaxID=499548 RepID=A0A9X1N9M2_9ACTN|nr:flagellar filament capping protein FliD [Kineosporia babensis]MCD5309824.1 flagellar filament capping protein FliD [Kineosporia babensis]
MASAPTVSFSGIASGMDTAGIIKQLVAVQGNQQTLLKDQQATRNSAVSAYSSMLSGISTTVGQLKSLSNTSAWSTTAATSSSAAVTATATGGVSSSLSFDVKAVARAHTMISDGSVASTGAKVASTGEITLKTGGSTTGTKINVGTGSLGEVVSAINGANAGVTASAVQTSPGNYRLQVVSSSTGEASKFELDGLSGFAGGTGATTAGKMKDLVVGANATIVVGADPDDPDAGYEISSATNTFNDVAQGISFSVSKVESGVTVSSAVDTTKVTDQISGVVTNLNNLLSSIQTNTAWDPATKKGGPLLGDSTVRNLQQQVLSTVSSMNAPGLSVTQGGQVQFDKAAFDTAFKADPAATMAAWGADSSFTAASSSVGSARFVSAGTATQAGSYDVAVSTPAKPEQWQVIPPGTGVVGRTVALMRAGGSSKLDFTLESDDMAAEAARLNTALAQKNMGMTASVDSGGTGIVVSALNPGAAGAFTATNNSGTASTQIQAGTDVAGTIEGIAATGRGNLLTLPVDADSPAKGLSVAVTASGAGNVGTLDYKPGVAQSLSQLLSQVSDSESGSLVQAQTTAKNQAKDLQTQIDAWTDRLEAYRATITAKFTAMETSLQSLKAQQTSLSSFFSAAEANSKA